MLSKRIHAHNLKQPANNQSSRKGRDRHHTPSTMCMTLASAVVKTPGLAYLANKVASSSFPVTDTAQVSCYDPTGPVLQRCEGTGQDGDYERLAQSYCEPQSGIVLDRTTGLVWTKAVVGPFSFAEALNSPPSTGGHTDWRLPTMKELYSLMDFNGSTGMTELDNVPYVNGIFEIAHGTTRFIYGQLWSTNTPRLFSREPCVNLDWTPLMAESNVSTSWSVSPNVWRAFFTANFLHFNDRLPSKRVKVRLVRARHEPTNWSE